MISAGTPFEGVEHLLERFEEKVFGTSGDAAADDDEFGVEDVNKRGNGSGEMADGGKPDFLSVFIARGIGIKKSVRGRVAAFASLGDGLIADGVFEASGRVEVIAGRVRIDAEVPEVAGAAHFSLHKFATSPDRSADAGAESEHENIAAVLRSSGPDFTEKSSMGIIEHATIAFEEGGPVEPLQAVHASRHPVDALAIGISQTGCGEADGEFRACLRFELVDDLAHGEGEARRGAVEFTIACGFRERGDGFRGLRVHEGGFDVRAAEVDADGQV